MTRIDVDFDFTSDTPGYWDDFWTRRNGLGLGRLDPDTFSPTLREYHKILWSRELPNGEHMVLETTLLDISSGTGCGSEAITKQPVSDTNGAAHFSNP